MSALLRIPRLRWAHVPRAWRCIRVIGLVVLLAAPAAATAQSSSPEQSSTPKSPAASEPRETVAFGATLETYYQFNWNRVPDRTLPLRAYDTRANTFSLQQIALVIDAPPDVAAERRYGGRIDLQFGQATETVQGSAANEPRPDVYRHLWQVYGSYVFPLGPKGLQADVGKFASTLGYETNYAKDNQAFSRAYLFNFLPFYHTGLRLTLPLHERFTVLYMLTNGVQQTEEFNDFKSSQIALIVKPLSTVTWTVNYYVGREGPDGGNPGGPDGRFTIVDTYATFTPAAALSLGLDVNHTSNQLTRSDPRVSLTGLGAYGRYQVASPFAVGLRYERLADEGLFGGVDQTLHEVTVTAEHRFADGFLVRAEYRRDWSSGAFFPGPRGPTDPRRAAADSSGWGHLGARQQDRDLVMLDVVFVTVTLFFFALAAAYVAGCERVK